MSPRDSGIGYFYTPENEEEAIALQRKRAYADALMQQNGTQGAYGGLADAGAKIAGALLGNKANRQTRDLAKSSGESYAKAMARLLGADMPGAGPAAPGPAAPVEMDENGAAIPSAPTAAGNGPSPRQSRMAQLLSTGDPRLIAQFAPTLFEHQLGREDKAEDRANMLADKQRKILSPQEAQQYGLRPGTVVEMDAFGGLNVVQDTDTMSDDAFKQKARLAEIGRMRVGGGGSAGKSVQSVRPLSDGTLLTVYRDGTSERTTIDGAPVIGAQYDPENKYRMSAASAGGKAAGTVAEALPTAEATFAQINRSLDAFDKPEVRAQADRSLGFIDKRAPAIAGYNADFMNQQKQIEGQTFLQAFNALRGAGQITEVEGTKATNALTRLQNAASAKEFYKARDEAKQVFAEIHSAVRQRASRGAVVPQMGARAPAGMDLPDPLGLRN